MLKKSLWLVPVLLLCLVLSLGLAGCGADKPAAGPETQQDAAQPGKVYRWQLQSAVPVGDPHMDILRMLASDIEKMSGGRLIIEPLPAGAVVGPFEILDAVNDGIVDAGQWWTHYATGKHPAAGLFNAPVGGAGTGIDQTTLLSWHLQDEGRELYVKFYTEILGKDVMPFIHAPDGPEALGWFKEPVATVEEFKKLRFRAPPGLPGEVYAEMGATPVSMPGAEIIPAAERGVIDAAEWINPSTDIRMGFQDIFEYYCLNGLHQVIGMSDIMINGERWRELPPDLQAIVQVATTKSIINSYTYFLRENSINLDKLVNEHGVTIIPAPEGYAEEFLAAAERVIAKYEAQDPFFKQVSESQKAYAKLTVPYRARNLETGLNMARYALDKN
ncbi:MAG: TRAP transporter substrate-binding protein [Clostridia bacterium]|nr:TRAP transporter substrate-binding protein [Clostridia bacterium]